MPSAHARRVLRGRTLARSLVAFAAATSISAAAPDASAFNLQTTTSGAELRWHAEDVTVVVDPSLDLIAPDGMELVRRAFAAWLDVDGVHLPAVTLVSGVADDVGYGGAGISTVRYAPDGFDVAGIALAITVLSHDDAGTILDADIVLNGGQARPFAELPEHGGRALVVTDPYDAQNVLTHEVGHFFGLGEQYDLPDATMFPTSGRGEVKKRDLADDDMQGVVALYSSGYADTGFGGCTTGAAGGGQSSVSAIVLATMLFMARLFTAAARRRPPRAVRPTSAPRRAPSSCGS